MTRLDKRKSRLMVETSDTVRERGALREVIIEADSSGYVLFVRLKGLRNRYPISPGGIYNAAVKIAVDKQRAERKAKRRGEKQ